MFEFKWLEDFMSLIELGNFSAAAKSRYVTQSAFSRRIQALELWVGVPLFDRSSYPIGLTEHGNKFVPYAENLLNQIKVTKEDFSLASLKTDNTVRIVCLHSFAINLLPNLLAQFNNQLSHLNISINPSVQGIDNHFQTLLDDSSDLLFAYNMIGMRPSISLENKLEKHILFKEKIIPVISPDLLKNHKDNTPWPLLSYAEHTFLYKVVNQLTKSISVPFSQVFETTLSESLIEMAINGIGVAWVPMHAVEKELIKGTLVPAFTEYSDWTIQLDVVCYHSKSNSRPAVLQFLEEIHSLKK
ncbi:LysR family transcriptional regulator [Aliivibrio fischeri]|uniref:LysR family transcriptional regulator n=1 Tax=Aliivibrio fischeri TaxID=668 RepID=UPI001414B012|nr:LysR family transcriptional regulator [Aliivibrio fischeri]